MMSLRWFKAAIVGFGPVVACWRCILGGLDLVEVLRQVGVRVSNQLLSSSRSAARDAATSLI